LTDTIEQCLIVLKNTKDIRTLLLAIGGSEEFNPHVIKEIKEKCPKLKILAVVERQAINEVKNTIDLGAAGCICKPFKSEEILSFIS
jgi:DNA-binding NarL/FixJ family response regulator